MAVLNEKYVLSNGVKIPKIALGTWLVDNNKICEVVQNGIKVGYRHIDTAQAYENEQGIGDGIKASGIARNKIFITTKIAAEIKTYQDAKKSVYDSLRRLRVRYLDLVIIHSPQPWSEFRSDKRYFKENIEVWRALEDLYKKGKIRAIGVSNFLIDDLQNIINNCEIKPMVNQVLAHISNVPFTLLDYCRQNNILVEAYSPIAHGAAKNSQAIIDFAKKYNVTVPQLCVRYTLELGMLPLPKAATIEHMIDNSSVNFKIKSEDIEALNNLKDIIDYGADKFFPVFKNS